MQVSLFTALILLVLTAVGFLVGRRRALAVSEGRPARLHSLPSYYGYYIALWTGAPAFLLLTLYGMFGADLVNSLALSELQRAAAPIEARYEQQLSEDEQLAALQAELDSVREQAARAEAALTGGPETLAAEAGFPE